MKWKVCGFYISHVFCFSLKVHNNAFVILVYIVVSDGKKIQALAASWSVKQTMSVFSLLFTFTPSSYYYVYFKCSYVPVTNIMNP